MFFLNDTATTEIYPLSLHDALPIYRLARLLRVRLQGWRLPLAAAVFVFLSSWLVMGLVEPAGSGITDRKSTRLNSSHANISYAVFCLKKTPVSSGASR